MNSWSYTDSKTLWEARLKVGEGKVESWPKTAARFQNPTRQVRACQTQMGKLQPVPNERGSLVPGL